MKASIALSGMVAALALALATLASCNGKVQVARSGCGPEGSSAFCDDGAPYEPPPDPGGCFGGGFCADPTPPPRPPACATDTFVESAKGEACVDHRIDPTRGGETCRDSRDCESVCCVIDKGRWVSYSSSDAGAGTDASSGFDSGVGAADASDGPDATVDASADTGISTAMYYKRVWECSCGRCPSAREVCESLNPPNGFGGP